MKKLLLSLSLLYCTSVICAQESNNFTLTSSQVMGQNLKNGSPIKGTSCIFANSILQATVDAPSNTVIILLKPLENESKTILFSYDFANNQTIWSKDVNLSRDKISLFKNRAIVTGNQENTYLNSQDTMRFTGPATKIIPYLLPGGNTILGYPQKTFTVSDRLYQLELNNGNRLWERKINYEFGWDHITNLNDSVLLITADGLHTIHLNNGKGWNYPLFTGSSNYTANYTKPLDSPYQSEFGIFPPANERQIYGMVSRPVIHNSLIYIASSDMLVCLNMDGKKVWNRTLPENFTGNSTIFIDEENIYLVNNGYAFSQGEKISCGQPYIASFDIKSGKQKYFSKVDKGIIIDSYYKDQKIYLLMPDKLLAFDAASGSPIFSGKINTTDPGLQSFTHSVYYQEENGKYEQLKTDGKEIYLINNDWKLISYNTDKQEFQKQKTENMYTEVFDTDQFKCISQGKKSILLDKHNQPIANLQTAPGCYFSDNRIIYTSGNNLVVIDISFLFNK